MLKQVFLITLLLLFLKLLIYYSCCVVLPQEGWECFMSLQEPEESPWAYYSQSESLQHFKVYPIGHKFEVITEHSRHWWPQPVRILICGDGLLLTVLDFSLKSITNKEKTILCQMSYLDKVGMNCLLYSAKMWWAALLQTESLSLLTPISTVGESEVEFPPTSRIPHTRIIAFCWQCICSLILTPFFLPFLFMHTTQLITCCISISCTSGRGCDR